MKIIIEQNIPFLEPLDHVANVKRHSYGEITASTVKDADIIVVRTRNRCDASLLESSNVKLVATATIGTDHIDIPWCKSQGIEVVNAPGCNAPAVAQYVFSSLMRVINRPLSSYRLGIVGVGHVGSIVARWARSMNMRVMLCDPPRQQAEGGDEWSSIDEIARDADIITFHTPLTRRTEFPTFHLGDEKFFNSLGRAPIIINSARGAVVDNKAWLEAIKAGVCGPAIIDCWENEPDIDRDLLNRAAIATPHIAGYSIEGKQRASQMVLDTICQRFNLPRLEISGEIPAECAPHITPLTAFNGYDPMADTESLKNNPDAFEKLRNTYKLRHELIAARCN